MGIKVIGIDHVAALSDVDKDIMPTWCGNTATPHKSGCQCWLF